MTDRPTADDLLEEARRSLMAEIVPQLSGKSRFIGLMVANAIGIARREIAQEARREKLLSSGLASLGIGSKRDAVQGLRSGKLGGQQENLAIGGKPLKFLAGLLPEEGESSSGGFDLRESQDHP